MNTTCGYGQMTRAEYKAGAPKRPICTRPATQYTTRPGTDYDNWYCDEHAGDAEPGTEIVDLDARRASKAQAHKLPQLSCGCCGKTITARDAYRQRDGRHFCGNCDGGEQPGCPNCDGPSFFGPLDF